METLELFQRLSQDLVVSPGDQLLVQADLQAQNMDGYESAFVQVRFYRKNFEAGAAFLSPNWTVTLAEVKQNVPWQHVSSSITVPADTTSACIMLIHSGPGIIDSQEDVGGWPVLAGTAWTDADADGMDDTWESAVFGTTAFDATADTDGNGYLNIEDFINSFINIEGDISSYYQP